MQPDVVVNCAALSIPRACETDPTVAMSINVPSSLIKWLSSFTENNTLLIHLSTDQGSTTEPHSLSFLSLIFVTRLFNTIQLDILYQSMKEQNLSIKKTMRHFQ